MGREVELASGLPPSVSKREFGVFLQSFHIREIRDQRHHLLEPEVAVISDKHQLSSVLWLLLLTRGISDLAELRGIL